MMAKKKSAKKSSKTAAKKTAKKTTKKTAKKTTKKAVKAIAKKKTKKVTKKKVVKKSTKKPAKKATKKAVKKSKKTKVKAKAKVTKPSDSKSSKRKNYSEIDKSVYELVMGGSEKFMEDLRIHLDLTPDEIRKALKRLEEKGKIKIQRVMEDGNWRSLIKPGNEFSEKVKKKKGTNLTWFTEGDLPCFTCPDIIKCSDGQDHFNPQLCSYLSEWLICQSSKIAYVSPFHYDMNSKKKKK